MQTEAPHTLAESSLVPLAVGMAAGIAAHALHRRYVYWTTSALFTPRTSPGQVTPQYIADVLRLLRPVENQFTSDLHTATSVGWGILVVTAMLVGLGLRGIWRVVAAGRHKPLPASWASEP